MKKRILLAGVLAATSFGVAAPATAGPGGYCDGTVDVVCREDPCLPGDPCHIDLCLVWVKGSCLAG